MRIAGRTLLATMLIRKSPRRLLLAAGISSAAALAGLLLFSGWLTSEDSPGLTPPPPEAEGGTIIPPSLTPPPEVTPASPTHIEIRGQQLPLAPGMVYYSGGTAICEGAPCPSGYFTEVRYDSNPSQAGWSWLVFDENYTLRGSHIRPEDQKEFQPLLDALASP
jgi:hypothetical protein